MRRIGRAIVFEQVLLEAFECDRAQEPRRHDAVGVEIVAAQRKRAAGDDVDGSHAYACTSSSI